MKTTFTEKIEALKEIQIDLTFDIRSMEIDEHTESKERDLGIMKMQLSLLTQAVGNLQLISDMGGRIFISTTTK